MIRELTTRQVWLRRCLLLALGGILTSVVILAGISYRIARLSPHGELARFVPPECQVWLEFSDLAEGIHALTRSREWDALVRSGRIARMKRTHGFILLQDEIRALEAALPATISPEQVLRLFGRESGVALHWPGHGERPDWIVLARTGSSLVDPAWARFAFSDARAEDYHDATLVELQHGKRTLVAGCLGNLVLVSNRRDLVEAGVDQAAGPGSGPWMTVSARPDESSAGHAGPEMRLSVHLGRLLKAEEEGTDTEPGASSLLGVLRERLGEMALPAEVLGLASIFLSDKVETLQRAEMMRVSAWFDGRWTLSATVAMKDGKAGGSADQEFQMPERLPGSVGYCSLWRLDFRSWFRQILEEESRDREVIQAETVQYSGFLGIRDFELDFLDLFGPEMALVIAPQEASGDDWIYPLPALAVMVQVRRPERVAAYLQKSVEQAMADMHADHEADQARHPPEQRKPFPFEVRPATAAGSIGYSRVELKQNDLGGAFAPAFGVVGDCLVITSSFRFIEALAVARERPDLRLSARALFRQRPWKLDASDEELWYIQTSFFIEAVTPVASSYVDTHTVWSPEKKNEIHRRLSDLAAFLSLFDDAVFTSRRETGRIRIWGVAEFQKK